MPSPGRAFLLIYVVAMMLGATATHAQTYPARQIRVVIPFQALYRTTSMGAAVRWMQEHGLPPPARGVRSNGEHAMLMTPPDTFGAYIGFVGPA